MKEIGKPHPDDCSCVYCSDPAFSVHAYPVDPDDGSKVSHIGIRSSADSARQAGLFIAAAITALGEEGYDTLEVHVHKERRLLEMMDNVEAIKAFAEGEEVLDTPRSNELHTDPVLKALMAQAREMYYDQPLHLRAEWDDLTPEQQAEWIEAAREV